MVRKSTLVLGGAGAVLAAGAVGAAVRYYQDSNTQQVPYDVVDRVDGVEVRRYPTSVIVETTADSENRAFMRLFRYIAGANRGDEEIDMTAPVESEGGEEIAMTAPVETDTGGEKIAMTAPVQTDTEGGDRSDPLASAREDGVRMAFYLPAEYDYDTAPRPTDPDVHLVEVPERTLAVLDFSWWATDGRVERYTDRLLRTLGDESGYVVVGDPILMRYEGPWVPPFLRTNEVAVEVQRITA